jgi:signal transduction histidine kinase
MRVMSRRQQDRISIGRSVAIIALLLGALSAVAAGALVWTSTQLRDAIFRVNRDMRSLAIADELHLSALTYQRVSNFLLSSGESVWTAEREDIAADQERLIREAGLLSGSEAETRLIDEVALRLEEYRVERQRLEDLGGGMESVMEDANPPLERFLSAIESLRDLNDVQVSRAYDGAMRISRRADLAGSMAAGLVLIALVLTVFGARRYVVDPIVELEETIERFRSGDRAARAEVQGPRESADLAEAFNEMADALARVHQAQRTFAAGVAHDLRNPIGGIQMALHTLSYDRPEVERRRTISLLQRQFGRLTRMLDDLLDATRIEAGDLTLELEDLDLSKLTEEVVRFYQPTTAHHDIVFAAPAGSPVYVRADAHRMEQVIGNLLSNAIKYAPGGGRIDVAVEADELEARVSVRDQGIGMSTEDVRDIFAPFRRRRPEVAEGAGLGLSVAQRLVNAHSGHIEVTSQPGRGSTFTIHLPRSESLHD